jgi:hypothetical protein
MIKAENFKIAEKAMNNAIEKIERQHGAFNYMCLDKKISHPSAGAE